MTNGQLRNSVMHAHSQKVDDNISFVQYLSNYRRRKIIDAIKTNQTEGRAYDDKTTKMFNSYQDYFLRLRD